MKIDRRWTLLAMGLVGAAAAFALGFRLAAAGVLAGTPVGLLNYQMMVGVRKGMGKGDDFRRQAGALMQRTMLRLLLSGGALLLASTLGPEFLIGALVGIVLEVLSYFGDALRLFGRHKE